MIQIVTSYGMEEPTLIHFAVDRLIRLVAYNSMLKINILKSFCHLHGIVNELEEFVKMVIVKS